ncbi:MAG: aspartate aminotransferase family protein [Rhizobiaceae bacterium]|nr:aspartate aminotransferase family protein [Rhizobiaceae bacterium]
MTDDNHIYGTFVFPEQVFERGEGVRMFDANGDDYIDCTSGVAVTALGHAHPHLVQTLKDAADKLWHVSNLLSSPERDRLATRLCEETFADKVFFTNSGAEAIECAIKTARKYHYDNGAPERVNIITFEGAFHGRTLATIAAGGQEKYLEGFGPKAPGFIQLPFDDLDALKAAIDGETAALMIEPVQGEGGIRNVSSQFLRDMRALCDENDILLIYDEIQTGVGRTGKLFAYEWSEAVPDIMAIAKGIGGGFPIGACLATTDAAKGMTPGTHGTTYGGNPLGMAIGNAVLDIVLEDGFFAHVNEMTLVLRQQLAEMLDRYPDIFEDTRGSGLLQGMKCKVPVGVVLGALRKHRVLALPAGENVVRFAPPLIITQDELREVRERMVSALDELQTTLNTK